MNWKVFLTAFGAIFLAELADKTQMVSLGMSAKSQKPWVVFFASVSAYMLVTAISVFVGAIFGKYIRPEAIRYLGAFLFILIGVLMLMRKM